jgi:hypothetical protein
MRTARYLPSPTAILVAAAGLTLLAVTLGRGISDPDYFWHITVGQRILDSGIPSTDPYSFTWNGQPWTPHEWLGEVLMVVIQKLVGAGGTLLVFGLVGIATLACIAWMLARRGARTLAIAAPVVLATGILAPFLTVRPQAISWLLIAFLLVWLDALRPERHRLALGLPVLFGVWANIHGLWVVGLGVLAVYTVFTLAGQTPMSVARGRMLVVAALSALATMLTPAGPAGILYPLRYIDAGDWGLANIQEWQSPDFHNPAHWAFLILILALIANGGRRAPTWLVALSWIGVAAGLMSIRNIPIAAVLAAPTLGIGLESRFAGPPRQRPARMAVARRAMEIVVAVVVVVVAFAVSSGGGATVRNDDYPAAAVDVLLDEAPDARVFAEYGWGGYVISRVSPAGGLVFVDGRNDMYAQQILEDYSAIRGADPGWPEIVQRYGVEAILVAPSAAITQGPALDEGWCERYRDDLQVLLLPCQLEAS